MTRFIKTSIVLLAFASSFSALAQPYSVHRKKQMFLGIYGGLNFTLPSVSKSYDVLTPMTENSTNTEEKSYAKLFENRGSQFGLHFIYCFTGKFSLVVQPGYHTDKFAYSKGYSWKDTIDNMDFEREFHHYQKLSYFTLPVKFRWDFTTNQLSPFVQVGIVADFRHQAHKYIHYDYTVDGVENENQLNSSPIASVTDHISKFNFGVVGGAGITYFTKYAVFGFESNFRYGFLPVINDKNRYADFSGFTVQYLDVFDKLGLSGLDFQFSVKVPITRAMTLNMLRRKRY